MQWLFAFLGLIIAAAADEKPIHWAIEGFLIGYLFNNAKRFKQLEQKIDALREIITDTKSVIATNPVEIPIPTPAPPNIAAIFIPPAESQTDLLATVPQSPEITKEIPAEIATDWESEAIPEKPTSPSDIEKLLQLIWSWFTDGNTFVRVGILILLIGVSFLLNLAIEHGFIPISLRLIAIALAGIGLIIIGWRLQAKHFLYALLIQSSGVGILYLTIFASFSRYHLLPAGIAFTLLVLIIALVAFLAIVENALSLALFGSIGGFLAPILTSTGNNNYIGLFSFYALLNAGIFAIAWFKAWRVLNLVGFGFTFSIATAWGIDQYNQQFFASTEPFLLLFFLFYVGIGILYATRRAPDFKDIIDGTLIFGTPILAFGLQMGMVDSYEYGVAFSAFTLGGFYLALANWVKRTLGAPLIFLSETFIAVAVIFLTLAIPFAVSHASTSATWAVEGTGVLWVSIRQQQFVRRCFALLLQTAAGIAFLSTDNYTLGSAFANSHFIGVMIISTSLAISSWLLAPEFESKRAVEKIISPVWLASSILWLYFGFSYQIHEYSLHQHQVPLILSLTVTLISLYTYLARRYAWSDASYAATGLIFPLLIVVLLTVARESHPIADYGWLLWPLAFTAYFINLKQNQGLNPQINLQLHFASGIFLAGLLFWEGFWQLLLGASLLAILFNECSKRYLWVQMQFLALGLLPVMVFLTAVLWLSGEAHPFALPNNYLDTDPTFESGFILWPLAFAVLYWLFYDNDQRVIKISLLPWFHALTLWLFVLLPTWEASSYLYLAALNGWKLALLPITTITALALMSQALIYPFKPHFESYVRFAAPPLRWFLMGWSLLALQSAAESGPLPWLPFLNPLDIMQIIVLLILWGFSFYLPADYSLAITKRQFYKQLAWFSFVWLNFVLLRTIHHWGGLFWEIEILNSPLTQTCLSIFWTLSGLSLTIVATRKQHRSLWLIGATFLVIVILKLFMVDLDAHGSIERIISFITVGALLMLIGYFAPLPPKIIEMNSEDSTADLK